MLRSYEDTVLVSETGLWPSSIMPFCSMIVLPRLAKSSLESANDGDLEMTLLRRCPSTVLLKSTSSGGTRAEEGSRDGLEDEGAVVAVVEGH